MVQKKTDFSALIEHFLTPHLEVWQHTVPPKPPFKEARLIHYNFDLSKRWYVVYYAWHEVLQKLVRVRQFEPMNRIKNINKRIEMGHYMVRVINGQLHSGKIIKAKELTTYKNIHRTTVVDAIKLFIEQKRTNRHRENYLKRFNTLITNWNLWLKDNSINDLFVKDVDSDDLHSFFEFLQTIRRISNKSFNNYRTDFGIVMNWLRKRHPELIKANPVENIPLLKVETRMHTAYSDAQMKEIKATCIKMGYEQLLLCIHFIYYTLARPGELRSLRIKHIDLKQNRIFIPASISKNGKDEYVSMPPALKNEIIKQKLISYDPEFLIFGKSQKPGPSAPHTNTFWYRNKRVLQALGLSGTNHDLYGYKHSGAINLYKQTKDIKVVQRQCRHQSIEQTNVYLRDLGAADDYYSLKHWKGAL